MYAQRSYIVLLFHKYIVYLLENAVEMNNVTATWNNDQQKKTLNGINLKIKQGQLCAIIGPVGAGKV